MPTETDIAEHSSATAAAKLQDLLSRVDDTAAAEELFALLYSELRRLAETHLRRQGHAFTLGATTLVHEAYLRMVGRVDLAFPDRARFFAYASRTMRGLAIDYSRQRRAQKRGRHLAITLEEGSIPAENQDASSTLSSLSDSLQELTELDARLAELVDLHFFGGLSFVEIAALRAVSERTVQRDWQKARLLLSQSLRANAPASTGEPELPF